MKKEEEIPKSFIDTVEFVINNSNIILDMLSNLAMEHMLGRDIRESLRSLKERHELLFKLIRDILVKNKKVLNWLSEIVEEDKRWIFSKIGDYSILYDEFEAVRLEDFGFLNPISSIIYNVSYNEDLTVPFLDIELISYGKKVLHFKEGIDHILWLTSSLMERVLECLKEYKDKPIHKETIYLMREQIEEIIKNSKETLKIFEEMITKK